MLTEYALLKLAQNLDELIVAADYRIGGTNYPAELRRSIVQGTTVRKHVYLTQEDPVGTVDRVRLFDAAGQVVASRTDAQIHQKDRGLLYEFRWTVAEIIDQGV